MTTSLSLSFFLYKLEIKADTYNGVVSNPQFDKCECPLKKRRGKRCPVAPLPTATVCQQRLRKLALACSCEHFSLFTAAAPFWLFLSRQRKLSGGTNCSWKPDRF